MITMKRFTILAVLIALLGGYGCASKSDVASIQADTRRQNAEQRRLIMELEEELAKSRSALKQEIEKSNDPVRQKTADIWVELNSLRQDFARLKGEMEVMQVRMDRQIGETNSTDPRPSIQQQLDNIAFALENQLNVSLPQDASAPGTETTAAAPSQPAKTVTVKGESAEKQPEADPAKALYDKAYSLYKEGKYEQARSYWAEFVKTFPKHAYVPSAIFWQGQAYYKLKEYSRAALLYDDVIQKHPKSSKYRAAMLKQAYSLNHLGKPEVAKILLQELVEKHPGTVEATQAKNFLEKLK